MTFFIRTSHTFFFIHFHKNWIENYFLFIFMICCKKIIFFHEKPLENFSFIFFLIFLFKKKSCFFYHENLSESFFFEYFSIKTHIENFLFDFFFHENLINVVKSVTQTSHFFNNNTFKLPKNDMLMISNNRHLHWLTASIRLIIICNHNVWRPKDLSNKEKSESKSQVNVNI